MTIVLGAIADDFTGATDLANNLVRSGMRCLQVIGVPGPDLDVSEVDAVVVALKSRSCPADEAVTDSLAALAWLQAQGARQFFFKYCSTFDSTARGNIGPVADALMKRLGVTQTVMVPAFPVNGRTVYQGHLFVGDRLLNDSGMQHHPLTPMTDADLVRVLASQTPNPVGLAPRPVLDQGAETTRQHLAALAEQGVRHVICDTLDEHDLDVLAEACETMPLVTGGSGLGQALPDRYRRLGWLAEIAEPGRLQPAGGSALVLSGSCSRATLAQVAHFLERHPGFALDPLALAEGDAQLKAALDFAREALESGGPVLLYASADPEKVKAAQARLGVEHAGQLVERALGQLAAKLVDEGVGRLVVAGGETSGAVVSALGIETLRIGEQIDPGVPWTQTHLESREAPLSLALKSGNFGGVDFFTRAFEVLP
ncbi:3-oxo-tetronate kinase [Billgrantia desiderata]|uniref:3-oxo-tetronate kinase n=1 Tax=Billgrantia desiderata TaxID=52021 RepID=A0AAW4YQD9_9GAMM|nr:3-oxo-tetronate kinase [Halomonas desiderata]MCE8030042.1 four-carbon acid sugar kinase family protein [Halomonas desiderata]MCE8044457.1 four-carbon acid sugar kinase family protein [Halomonas desiderata]MCE8049031.1 four-carbon acid sugar kinase family protein [Halomonas desiderata]MCE8050472.1 four-carbon acid sugar kinase family protein [Halomonas desiderata]